MLANPFTDVLEWFDESNWLKGGNVMGLPPGKHTMQSLVWDMSVKYTHKVGNDRHYELFNIVIDTVRSLYPDRISKHGSVLLDFNVNPQTTFKDIQSVLISCAESWRNRVGSPTKTST